MSKLLRWFFFRPAFCPCLFLLFFLIFFLRDKMSARTTEPKGVRVLLLSLPWWPCAASHSALNEWRKDEKDKKGSNEQEKKNRVKCYQSGTWSLLTTEGACANVLTSLLQANVPVFLTRLALSGPYSIVCFCARVAVLLASWALSKTHTRSALPCHLHACSTVHK